jgi:hypothetical protein
VSSNPQVTIGVSAVDNAKQVLEGVDSKVSQTADIVVKSGDKMQSKTAQASSAILKNWQGLATGAATLGAGIVSFATSFDTLEKAALRTDQAQLTYSRSLERLNDLQKSGKASSADLSNAQEQLRINAEKLKQAQDSQNDTYTNFLAQVPLQMLSFGTSFVTMATTMGISTGTLTSALGVLKAAMISAFVTNPAGIAILAVTTLVAALVFNIGGLRDAFVGLGKVILDFLDRHFKPLADAIRWFIDGIQWLTGQFSVDLPSSIDTSASAVTEFSQVTQDASVMLANADMQIQNIQLDLGQGIPAAVDTATASLDVLDNKLTQVADKAKELHSSIRGNQFEESKGGVGFGAKGRSAQAARDKYGVDDVDYVNGRWVPGGARKGQNVSENIEAFLRRYRSGRTGVDDSEFSGYVSRYGSPNVSVTVIDTGKGYDVTVQAEGYSKTIQTLKATSQVLDGVGT